MYMISKCFLTWGLSLSFISFTQGLSFYQCYSRIYSEPQLPRTSPAPSPPSGPKLQGHLLSPPQLLLSAPCSQETPPPSRRPSQPWKCAGECAGGQEVSVLALERCRDRHVGLSRPLYVNKIYSFIHTLFIQ